MAHYIAMSGDHGCIPDHCQAHPTLEEAVNDLAELFGLGRARKKELRNTHYLELTLTPIEQAQGHSFGAGYCEIQECCCDNPQQHCDSGEYNETD